MNQEFWGHCNENTYSRLFGWNGETGVDVFAAIFPFAFGDNKEAIVLSVRRGLSVVFLLRYSLVVHYLCVAHPLPWPAPYVSGEFKRGKKGENCIQCRWVVVRTRPYEYERIARRPARQRPSRSTWHDCLSLPLLQSLGLVSLSLSLSSRRWAVEFCILLIRRIRIYKRWRAGSFLLWSIERERGESSDVTTIPRTCVFCASPGWCLVLLLADSDESNFWGLMHVSCCH